MKKLTPKEIKFVELYIKTGNLGQSYLDAGYKGFSNSTPKFQQAHIQEYYNKLLDETVEEVKKEISLKEKITVEWILQQYLDLLAYARAGYIDGRSKEHRQDTVAINQALRGIRELLGTDQPSNQNINITNDQPLFGPLDNE